MKFTGHVEEYILRNLGVVRGKKVHIMPLSKLFVFHDNTWKPALQLDGPDGSPEVEIANILPGFDEVYAPHTVHCTKVLYKTKNVYNEEIWIGVDVNDIVEVASA